MRTTPILLVLVLCFSGDTIVAQAVDDGFMNYWAKFRAAALRDDMTTLASLTRFPLEVGSENDSDHPGHLTRAMFPSYMKTELRCPALDTGSQLDMIKRRVQLNPVYDYHKDGRATVGSLDFQKFGTEWKFITIDEGTTIDFRNRLKGKC